MKNIHVTSTDKPSSLFKDINGNLGFNNKWFEIPLGRINQHIYITDDSEIKEGDWLIYENGNIVKADENLIFNCSHEFDEFWRKVILTTDHELIVDGVQPIDDTFIEWFVKNPSCEEVKIESWQTKGEWDLNYKIIIPSEEPTMITDWLNEYGDPEIYKKVERELELREAAQRLYPIELEDDEWDKNKQYRDEWIEGAKWQQERMYSEEEVFKIIASLLHTPKLVEESSWEDIAKWFEQFKKK